VHIISCEAAIVLFPPTFRIELRNISLGRMVKLIRDIGYCISEEGSSVCLYVSGFQ
jgi:hypothetical protein